MPLRPCITTRDARRWCVDTVAAPAAADDCWNATDADDDGALQGLGLRDRMCTERRPPLALLARAAARSVAGTQHVANDEDMMTTRREEVYRECCVRRWK
jgi:hypothetical protein